MIKKASYSILNILGFNARFYVCDLDLDPGDELTDSSTSTNNLFQGGIKPSSSFFGTFKFYQQVFRTRLFNSMDCDTQFFTVSSLGRFRNSGVLTFPIGVWFLDQSEKQRKSSLKYKVNFISRQWNIFAFKHSRFSQTNICFIWPWISRFKYDKS